MSKKKGFIFKFRANLAEKRFYYPFWVQNKRKYRYIPNNWAKNIGFTL